MSSKPRQLDTAQRVCRILPPFVAGRVREMIYPKEQAYKDDYVFEVRSVTGGLYTGRTSDPHGYKFSVHGYFDWRNWAVALALCRPGDTIIEIGANVGTETIGFLDIVGPTGHVKAFEPLPRNVEVLEKNKALNQAENLCIFQLAVGSSSGVLHFVVPASDHESGIGHFLAEGETGETIEVNCTTLDEQTRELGQARLVHMDVEGAELDVLKGGAAYFKQNQPALLLEASPKCLRRFGHSLGDLYEVIQEVGYVPFEITRFGLTEKVRLDAPKKSNWVCLPQERIHFAAAIRRYILWCGFMPVFGGINPLHGARDRSV